jgi:uncharacterized protein (TIGR03437 family)
MRADAEAPNWARDSAFNQAPVSVWLVLVVCGCCAPNVLFGQLVANGQQLVATTNNTVATFQGPDLVGIANTLTGETYLKSPPPSPLMNLETFAGGASQSLQSAGWTTTLASTGSTAATLTMQDSMRSVTITVSVDPASQEIVITLSGQTAQPGAANAYWAVAGLDLSVGHLIVPASSGIVLDHQHEELGSIFAYPYDWAAQMAVYETSSGSFVLYSTDAQYLFKQLRVASRSNPLIDLSIATEANGPWPSATSVPAVEWRLKSFAADWRSAAAVYRDWLVANRPPVSNGNHAWVSNIATVIQLGTRDPSILDSLAAELTPSKTLIYIPDWRQSGYDENYPDYTPASDVPSFVAKAHTLGFKVMLHTDLIGVTPSNAAFASVDQWQLKDPGTLQLVGWEWSSPPSTPNRFAWIDPASSVFRKLFVSSVGAAVAAVQPDALHLDVSGVMFNDGNGPIEGMNYGEGMVQLHKDIIAAFPNLALGGEAMNDAIYCYNSFAQNWWVGDYDTLVGHPVVNFLWNSRINGEAQIQYYGHLGQPEASDPSFKNFVALVERQGILPTLAVNSAADLDLTNADNARFTHWLQSWQTNEFQPDWNGDWSGVLIPYAGTAGSTASAALSDSGTVVTLTAGGAPIYQRVHDTVQQDTSSFVLNWPAFDAEQIYGLDPGVQYWLDAVARPETTHITSLPSGLEIGAESMVSSTFAFVQLTPTNPYNFLDNLWAATIGITFNGADGPLGFGATAQVQTTTAGGMARQGIFMQPPYTGGRAGGQAFVQWQVPVSKPSAFSFSVGVDDSAGDCTDGVSFRVAVNGVEAWRQNVLHQGWVAGIVDLSSYVGTVADVRIVTDPGPAGNTNCDWASFSDLALTSLDTVKISVPLALGSGAIPSGFSGSGTFSSAGSGGGTISGVPVPGQFVFFLAPGTSADAGTALSTLPFTTWLGVDGQVPVPATIFGSGSISTTSSGGATRQNAISGHPPNNGRTILAWTLALPSTGSLQLGWSAGMEDNCPSNTGVKFSLRINGITYWNLFQQAAEGWKPGALDLTSWKGQNVLLQLATDSVGDNDCDHAQWADLAIGPSTQACSITVPSGASVPKGGSNGSIAVTAGSDCPWSATASVPWISLTSSQSGIGSGTVAYTVLPNTTGARVGTISVGGEDYAVMQAAGANLTIASATAGQVEPFAAESIVSVYGADLAVSTAQASLPLGTSLAGTTVMVTDSAAVSRPALLFYVSPAQINCEIPAGAAVGPATVSVTNINGVTQSATIQIGTVSPGLFTLTGSGLAAALVLRVISGIQQPLEPVYQVASGSVAALPIDLGPATNQVYLEMYGTGIRGARQVTVTVGGVSVPVLYAAGAPGYAGEDQVNIGPLPPSLAGKGNVNIVLNADGQEANPVNVTIQ